MKYKIAELAIIVLSVLLMSAPVLAETKYVSDEFEIMLRRGQTVQHDFIRQLKSGTPVKVLESNAKYSLVRTNSGAEGWV